VVAETLFDWFLPIAYGLSLWLLIYGLGVVIVSLVRWIMR
jgi:hypothetical protein